MFQNWLNNLPKDLAYVLEKKGIKNRFFGAKKAQPVEAMANQSRLWPTGQPVEEPVDRLRSSDRGPVKAMVTYYALNASTTSEPVNP